VFHYFTIKFHFSFFASLRFKFFASLHFSNFCFEAKQSEAKFKSIFLLFFALNFSICFDLVIFLHFFSLFTFFSFFYFFFALNFSIRFNLVIFASKRNKAKRNSSLFFSFFSFFHFFLLIFAFLNFFCLIFVSLRFFHLFLAYFTFVFASEFWCFASK
jgi:hypothetical protein